MISSFFLDFYENRRNGNYKKLATEGALTMYLNDTL